MQKRLYFPELQSLRGIGALLICIYHVKYWYILNNLNFINNFNLAVDFFFVLSGFVITLNFSKIVTNAGAYKAYLVKRFFRLYPLFLLVSIPYFIISILKTYFHASGYRLNYFDVPQFLYYITLTYKWGFVDGFIFNAPSWSISVELLLYIVAGLIFMLKKSRTVNILINLLIIIASMVLLLTFSRTLITADRLAVFRGAYSFFIGGIVCYVYDKRTMGNVKISSSFIKNLFFFLTVLVIFAICHFFNGNLAFAFPFAGAGIIYFVVSNNYPAYFIRFLNLRCMVYLGAISYSVYLTHPLMIFVTEKIFKKPRLETNSMASMIAILTYIVLIIIVSGITYRFIEEPGKVFYKRFGFAKKEPGGKSRETRAGNQEKSAKN